MVKTDAAPLRGIQYKGSWPDTRVGWIQRIEDTTDLDPCEQLTPREVAAEITRLRRPDGPAYKTELVRQYLSNGSLPVPLHQMGGRKPGPGDKIRRRGKPSNASEQQRFREPRKGEMIDPIAIAWERWQIWQWEAHRPGSGFRSDLVERDY